MVQRGINPRARAALFRLIPSTGFPDTPTQSRGRGTQISSASRG